MLFKDINNYLFLLYTKFFFLIKKFIIIEMYTLNYTGITLDGAIMPCKYQVKNEII